MTSPFEAAILASNRAFYEAFAERNVEAMDRLWAREHVVACTHPGRAAIHGREAVIQSWRAILASPDAPRVTFTEATAMVLGETAFVTCVERIYDAQIAATNIFALERGEWRLVHHHAGAMAPRRDSRRPPGGALN